MNWFLDKKISTKLIMVLGSGLMLTVLLGAFAIHELSAVAATAAELGGDSLEGTRKIDQITFTIDTYRRWELRMLVVALTAPGDLRALQQADGMAQAQLQKLKENETAYVPLIDSAEEKTLYDDYVRKRDEYLSYSVEVRSLIFAGKVKEAAAMMANGLAKFTAVSEAIAADSDYQKKQSDEAVRNSEATYKDARNWIIGVLSVSVVVGFFVTLWTARLISRPVQEVVAVARKIATGDLTSEDIANRSADEVGELSQSINAMKHSLRDTISSVSTGAERIATASEEFSATAAEQAQGAQTQKDQTNQVAAAMQEMSSTVQQVSENSNSAAEASRRAAETARQGGQIVDHTLAKMRAIANSVGQTAQKVQELGKSSAQIGQIIGVIDDIADQTNLLALNAAIEAARAGEQGRGFAVVADEVRKLAERTSKATKEITLMIQNIQTETQSAVEAMQSGTTEVDEGVKSTMQAGSSLQEIINASEQVGSMVMQIATAATEQASANDEINTNIEQIAKISEESANGATEAARAVSELSNLAADLQGIVGKFRLKANGGGRSSSARRGTGAGRRSERREISYEEAEQETVDA